MKQTTNYKFNKPELTDVPDITQLNQNFDTIDVELKAHDTEIEALDAALDGKAASSHIHTIGDLPLASVAEAKAGSIDTKVMTPAKAKESALTFGMAIKAENPITSTANDTPSKWNELGSGVYNFTMLNCLNNQPNQWGILINFVNKGDVFQIWKSIKSGVLAVRAGNASGWGETWKTCANTDDLKSYLPLAGGDITGTVTFGDHSIFTNSNGDLLIGDYDNGALLRVRSNASDDNSGGFQFRAEHEGVNHFFIGKPAGKLTWGGKNIVRSVNGVFADDAGNVANNQFKSKATNIITKVSDDTQAKWATIEAGVYWFSQSGCINDQPSQYGFLIHYTSGGEIFQLWRENPSGAMWYRGANPTGGWNNTTWKKLANSDDLIVRNGNLAVNSENNSYMQICGGKTSANGGTVAVYGVGHSTMPGAVVLTDNGNTPAQLQLVNAGITHGGKNLVKSVNGVSANAAGEANGTFIRNGFLAQNSVDNNLVIVRGGTDSTSAFLGLCGKNFTTMPGAAYFTAADGTNTCSFIVRPNGTTTLGGSRVISAKDIVADLPGGSTTWTLPSGGTWRYFLWDFGGTAHGTTNTAAGGTTVTYGEGIHMVLAIRIE